MTVFFKKYYCIFISKKGRWNKFLVYIITSMTLSMQMSEGVDIWLYLSIIKEDRKGRENKTPGHLKFTIHLIMKKDSKDWCSKVSSFPEVLTTILSQFSLYFSLLSPLHSTPSHSHQTLLFLLSSKSHVSTHLKTNSRSLNISLSFSLMHHSPIHTSLLFKSNKTR